MKTVCLIGKPNVGKSSIFNRLIKEKKSIICIISNCIKIKIKLKLLSHILNH